ncbi:DUF882 domain-containing protein [Phyllobacterium zundukense]|uniref:DUF882 domain-containing protein n=2 Tax=Phyllobacterium zundukense TaxID=1867719 RepID=A0ACD4D074_9HYPH|nr:DUF882 domain-containing protein [Phyllobacterium zundukense]
MRAGWFVFLMVFVPMLFASAQASAETRTLRLYFIHTKERAEITFKRNGRYQQDGLNKLNKFLRDWRRNEPTKMDPRLFDLVWQIYQNAGGRDYINVVSAYRSPTTNSMLRSRSRGVAKTSQHMLGKAMDWYLPGVKLSTLRVTAMKFQAGGVGYYPTSGSPFIHTDVGNVRHWPRMSRRELLAVFPDGKTMHIPSDGKPLPGYDQAVAAYESRRRNGGSAIQVASASSSSSRSGKTLFGMIFGGGADEEEDTSESRVAVATASKPSKTLSTKPAAIAEDADGGETAAPAAPAVATRAQPQPEQQQIAPDLRVRGAPAPLTAPRPDAPLATSPEDGRALAFAVPVPLRRPDYSPTPAPGEPSTLNALAEDQSTVIAALPMPRPQPQDSASAIREMIAANPDDANPDTAQPEMANALVPVPFDKPKRNDMMVASLVPDQRPVTEAIQATAAAEEVVIPAPEDDDLQALIKQADSEHGNVVSASQPTPEMPTLPGTTGGRVKPAVQPNTQMASIEAQPSLRRTMLDAQASGDPVAALNNGVITTAKGAKPRKQTAQGQAPKAIQVSSDVPDRALSTEQVAETAPAVTPAVLRNAEMRMAPTTVYTAGFQQSLPVANANKFTGKAVTFLQIAKFNPTHGS